MTTPEPEQPQGGQPPTQPGLWYDQSTAGWTDPSVVGQPGYGAAPNNFPPPAQPSPGQPFPGQPYPGQPHMMPAGYPAPQPDNGDTRKRGVLIALVVALVLALGGGATWWALSERDAVAAGASSPEEAVSRLFDTLSTGDLLGAVESMAPGEGSLVADLLTENVAELQRLGVLTQDAEPSELRGFTLTASELRFDRDAAERVNDHVTITKLTGGSLTVDADLAELPVAKEYRDAIPERAAGAAASTRDSLTVDIGSLVEQTGEPMRIAAVKVDGDWYPSLLYTLADYALLATGEPWPQESIPARGADSPTDAVRQVLEAALEGDIARVIELLPPDEMAVLHDLGPLLVNAFSLAGAGPSGITLQELETDDTAVTGGTRATLTKVSLQIAGQGPVTVAKSGDCYEVTAAQGTRTLCGAQIGTQLAKEAEGDNAAALAGVLSGLGESLATQGVAVVTTEKDGKHYVSPLRTISELGRSIYRGIDPEALKAILREAN